jgi:hypothetical protein
MKFSILAFLTLTSTSAYASLCSVDANFPPQLVVGSNFNIPQTSASSPDGKYQTKISGRIRVASKCTLVFESFSLYNAPGAAVMYDFDICLDD